MKFALYRVTTMTTSEGTNIMKLRMKVHKVLNLRCQTGRHDQCMGISKGSKSDPNTFVCTCECHTKTNLTKKEN
jgi:hypothetical protein